MPHDNTQQASQEATYMKPEDVNFTKPFLFVLADNKEGDVFAIDNFHSGDVKITWNNTSYTYRGDAIKGFINRGDWLVLKQPESTQEALFGSTFRFTDYRDSQPTEYIYTAINNTLAELSWTSPYGVVGRTAIPVERCIEELRQGYWKLLPSETPQEPSKLSDEESFAFAEQIVSKALAPAGKGVADDYMTLSVHRVGSLMKADIRIPANSSKEVVDATQKILDSINAPLPSLLIDTIKDACKATSGRLSVHTTQNGFEVYHPWFVDHVKVVDEDVLEKLLRVIVLVEGEGGN